MVSGGVLVWAHRHSVAVEAARVEAIAAAPGRVEALLSYNAPTVDRDLDAAAGGATGSFKDGFVEFGTKTVAPQSKEKGISTKARVVDVGFISGATDHAELLLFVDQITTSVAQPAPATTSSRVRVGVERVDGQWLVSELTPV
ncbi:hypothetical protein FK531_15600 [Rhodococcus spelaei]|uniref:Mce-associated membrane protein n=2 Tax=Rhodococcus spelaei TaxID=2546320 RepID=A0A541B4J9_9NOCA|nr:hypothetical protein FK531_15600 [Rhodococcus spelaei]